jgi:uncharacterized membrane protein YcjF (UPF0283 family)
MTFFLLWRTAILVMLGYAAKQLYGWEPTYLLVLVIFLLGLDTIATAGSLKR